MRKRDPAADFHRLRCRRQGLAGAVRQAIDDLERTPVVSRYQPDKAHELKLLRQALAALGQPSMPSADERAFHRQLEVIERSLNSLP